MFYCPKRMNDMCSTGDKTTVKEFQKTDSFTDFLALTKENVQKQKQHKCEVAEQRKQKGHKSPGVVPGKSKPAKSKPAKSKPSKSKPGKSKPAPTKE